MEKREAFSLSVLRGEKQRKPKENPSERGLLMYMSIVLVVGV
jgi:hypothetical protein